MIYSNKYEQKRRRQTILLVVVGLLAIILAFVVGYFVRGNSDCVFSGNSASKKKHLVTDDEREKLYDSMVECIKASNIDENLKFFLARPHAAATEQNNKLLDEIYRRYESYKFITKRHTYSALLSLPDPKQPNYVYISDNEGNVIFKSLGFEKALEPSESDPTVLRPFNAYGASGKVEGELVYVNYGRLSDFEELERKYKVNISGKIALVRYGGVGRANKVKIAEEYGAIGVIIYSDPRDVAPIGKKFLEGRWLPDDGIQRGSVMRMTGGDISSQGYAGKSWYYHDDIESIKKSIPSIPVQPISAYDAEHLMKYMGGVEVDKSWRGKLNISSYRIGPYSNTSRKVSMEVFNKLEMKNITNVCGTIVGEIEPDRYILFGNHVDAWVFGGVDPSSGTSTTVEVARVISEKLKEGWRPRRTIKFCHWDGEEPNAIGSGEFVEEFYSQLRDRAVVYINLDSAVGGNETFFSGASPLLHEMMFKVHRKVKHPSTGNSIFYESRQVLPDKNYPDHHEIVDLGTGFDFVPFYQYLGIPSMNFVFTQFKTHRKLKIGIYPMYHSLHDTYYWMKRFTDPDFKFHQTVGKIAMYYLLYLSDSIVIPFDVKRYSEKLQRGVDDLSKVLKAHKYKDKDLYIDVLRNAVDNFTLAYNSFVEQKKSVDVSKPLSLRILNDRLCQLEKGFLYVNGVPGRQYQKHYIIGPTKYNGNGQIFPSIKDSLIEAEKTGEWKNVKREITITSYIIQSVADNLLTVY